MGDFVFTKKAQKAMQKIAKNRLHTVNQQGIVPYLQDRVRVNTGRMRESIDADYPDYNAITMEVSSEVVIGGVGIPGVVKEIGITRDVDYVEDLYDNMFPGELDTIFNQMDTDLSQYVPI